MKDIIIGRNNWRVLADFVKKNNFSSVFVLTDKTVGKLYSGEVKRALPRAVFITVPAGEKHKNLTTLERIWRAMFKHGADRHSLLINLGGGVVCDMGGLAAAMYMRGIKFVQVPTTLLAQVDASAGGKTAVDLDGAKNIIGAFLRPALVLINTDTLKTLPKKQFLSGMAEVLKHGFIKDKKYLSAVVNGKLSHEDLIKGSCEIKSHFVDIDEAEKGPRKILNFGHTVGHAVETLSFNTRSPLSHGEAVALGMIAEARLSALCGLLKEADFIKIKEIISSAGFKTKFPLVKKADILKMILKDKKNKGKIVKWTLLNAIGSAVYDAECRAEHISASVEEIL